MNQFKAHRSGCRRQQGWPEGQAPDIAGCAGGESGIDMMGKSWDALRLRQGFAVGKALKKGGAAVFRCMGWSLEPVAGLWRKRLHMAGPREDIPPLGKGRLKDESL